MNNFDFFRWNRISYVLDMQGFLEDWGGDLLCERNEQYFFVGGGGGSQF